MSEQDAITTSRQDLVDEIARLKQLLAEAGTREAVTASDARDASAAHAVTLAGSRQETLEARQDTSRANAAATQAASEYRGELAAQRAEVARQANLVSDLRTSEGRLRLILESASDFAIFATDLDGLVTEWNFGARNVLGWSEAEMLGQDVRAIWTPEDREAGVPEAEMRDALQIGRAADDRWHLRRDGTRFWATGKLMPMLDDAGTPIGYIKIIRDRTEQHETGRRLAESELRWRSLFEQLGEGLVIGEVVRDADGRVSNWRYLQVNPSWGALVDMPPEQAVGRTIRELFPGIEDSWITDVAAAFETDGAITFTQEVRSLNRWYEGRIQRLDGDRFTVLLQEVTRRIVRERRRTALLELGDRLRDIVDPGVMSEIGSEILGRTLDVGRVGYGRVMPDAETFVVERDWTAPGFPSLAGTYQLGGYGTYTGELLRGLTVSIADVREDARTVGTADRLEAVSVRSLANVPLFEGGRTVAILYLNSDRPRVWTDDELVFVQDVAERLRQAIERRSAEEGLRRSEAELQVQRASLDTLIRQAPIGISIADATTGAPVALNDRAQQLLGHAYLGNDVERYTRYGAVHADGRPYAPEDYPTIRACRTGETVEREQMLYRSATSDADDGIRRLEVSSTPIRDADGRVAAAITVIFDVEEERRAAELLQSLNEELERRVAAEMAERARTEEQLRQLQKMEAVGQLTGGLAHDFNNLLTGITGSLELLSNRLAQGRVKDVDRFVAAAQGAAKRAAALTHRLLAFSRQQTLDPRPTDVNRLVSGMEDLVRRTVGPAIELEIVGAGGLWPSLVDPPQLENALLNLCINARDAMPDGGRLTIETGNRWLDEREARERDLQPGQYISLCVSDTGTGMTPEVIARAFEPFFTTKPLGQGTGLGLSMIYGFARQSGGQVRIYSELGQGSMLCLYLPRHLGAADAADSLIESSGPPRRGAGETVLVVDDEPTVRMLITEVLDELGYTVTEAADAPSGLKVLQSNIRINLLISDVGLPGGMNGRQMADAARVSRPDLKVLFITGYAENAVVGNGHLDHGMEVLTKPFAIEALSSRIRNMLIA